MTARRRSIGKSSIGPVPVTPALFTSSVQFAAHRQCGLDGVAIGDIERELLGDVEIGQPLDVPCRRDHLVASARSVRVRSWPRWRPHSR